MITFGRAFCASRKFFKTAAALLAFSVIRQPALAAADPQAGPVSLPIQHPLWVLHGSLPPASAEILEPGAFSSGSILSWTSTFDREARAYRFDEERVTADLSLAYGATDGLEIGAHLPLITRGGGILDSFIEDWHDVFQLPNGGRERFGQDNYEMTADYHDGSEKAALGSSGSGIGNPDLWFKIVEPALHPAGFDALKFTVSLPVATDTFGHDGLDAGAQLLGGSEFWSSSWNWGAGYMLLGDDQIDQVRFRDNLFSAFLAYDYRISDNWRLKAGLLYSSSPLKDVVKYPDYALYLDLGLRVRLSDSTGLDLMIREDPLGRAAADISFVAGISTSWPG